MTSKVIGQSEKQLLNILHVLIGYFLSCWSRMASHIWWLAGCQLSQLVTRPHVFHYLAGSPEFVYIVVAWLQGRVEMCKVSRDVSSELAHHYFHHVLCQSKSQGQIQGGGKIDSTSWWEEPQSPLQQIQVQGRVKNWSHFCNQSNTLWFFA